MGSGDDSGGKTYYFNIGDADPPKAIIDAVTRVTGADPTDVAPLHEAVDAETVNALLNQRRSSHVSFRLAGVEVTVTGSDEIVIEAPHEPESLSDQLDGASTVLLLAPDTTDEPCGELLAAGRSEHTAVLSITFSQSAYERLQVLDTHLPDTAVQETVISMGEFTRSGAAHSDGSGPVLPVSVEPIDDPTDLTALGVQVNEYLNVWTDTDTQTVACFHSLTDLLAQVDEKTAFRFLHVLNARFQAVGAIAHYHMDPAAHDAQTIATFRPLFDAVVEIDETGTRTVKPH